MILFLSFLALQAADPMNLGFERAGTISPDRPMSWGSVGQGDSIALDSVTPQSGSRSLRVRPLGTASANAFGGVAAVLPGATVAGKVVRLRVYIRIDGR